jgi:UDP-3-O-[3-hydroxymyristoyl] glucosamine N-acyltransferase
VVIGSGVTIGPECELWPQVTVRDDVTLGARVRIDCGSSIATEGFTVVVREEALYRLPQVGTVVIGDDVDVGAHVTIDRATFDATRIGNGVKMDNHVHIAHNVVVGDHTLLVAYAKIAGSTTIGEHVVVAEDVGITDNVTIGDGCRIGGGSRVFRSLPPGTEWWGHPARPLAQARRIAAALARLPQLRAEVRDLRRRMDGRDA